MKFSRSDKEQIKFLERRCASLEENNEHLIDEIDRLSGRLYMISGELLQKFLLIQYAIITIVYFCEGNVNKGIYWLGALIVTYSVLVMK